MPIADKQLPNPQRTRRAVIEMLKRTGPQDARTLALALGLSPMAVRLHLYQLQDEQMVTFREERRPLGRPIKRWQLTRAAGRLFPDRHWELIVSLLAAVKKAFGRAGLMRVLALYRGEQARLYLSRMRRGGSLISRVRALSDLRSEDDYMAEVVSAKDGGFILAENHCPISTAATSYSELCAAELEMFRTVLGKTVAIERCEHIRAGAARCAYHISARSKSR